VRPALQALTDEWARSAATFRFSSGSVSLDRRQPDRRGPVLWFVLYLSGQTWFNVGCLRDAGLLDDARADVLFLHLE
jgi:hypothetical protein